MVIALSPGPAPVEPAPASGRVKIRTCFDCGWEYVEQRPETTAARCELCNGLWQDTARWVQTHPRSRESLAREAREAWLGLLRALLTLALVLGAVVALSWTSVLLEFVLGYLGP